MKTKLKLIIGVAAIVLATVSLRAQTTNQIGNFLNTAETYVTSFNTNYTFSGVTLDAESGYKQVTGANAASYVALDYYATANWEVEGTVQFSGVGSPINSAEIGGGYAVLNHYDTRVTLDLLAGYDDTARSIEVEPKAEIKKKLTANTFASVAVSFPVFFKQKFNSNPTFWAGVGFTY